MAEQEADFNPISNTPDKVKYSDLISQGTDCTTTERVFVPNNGTTFNYSNVKTIRIPLAIQSDHFLDTSQSFLRFKIKNTTASVPSAHKADIYPDPTYYSVFRRLRWEGSDGQSIEDLNHANLLHSMLYRLQVGQDHYSSIGTLVNGGADTSSPFGHNQGIGSGESITVTVGLLSTFWNAHRYCPAGFVKGSPLTLELELDNPEHCLYSQGNVNTTTGAISGTLPTINYEITNVELVCQAVHFSSGFNQTFNQMLQSVGGVQYHSTGYHSVVNVAQSGSDVNINIPVRTMSLKGIVHVLQDNDIMNTHNRFCLSERVSRFMKDYVHYIGGASFPIKKVQLSYENQGHAFMELLKCFGNMNNIHASSHFKRDLGMTLDQAKGKLLASGETTTATAEAGVTTRYKQINAFYPKTRVEDNKGTSTDKCSFLIGHDFENFQDQNLISGLDLSSQSLPITLQATVQNYTGSSAATDNTPTIITSFVHSDYIYTLTSDGVISTSN